MRYLAAVAVLAYLVEFVASTPWIPSFSQPQKRNNDSPASKGFVTAKNGQLFLNGQPFHFSATNAYWLQQVSDDDIETTLRNISLHNITVVRTWGFNDVLEIPTVGSWFQLLNPNGTATINTGANGLQRLDRILAAAERHGLMIQVSLTNNWNPAPSPSANATGAIAKRAGITNVTHPRGFLSNDYGGMDAYVRAHNLTHHDDFFTNQTLIDAFKNYLTALIPRYSNSTQVLAWEVANDARCNSTLPNNPTCTAQTVTKWHSIIAQHIKTLDKNHLVSSGCQGFLCVNCPKLFPPAPAPVVPAPVVSPTPGQQPRAALTERGILAQQRNKLKRNADAAKKRREGAAEKLARGEQGFKWSYRGRASNNPGLAKRQTMSVGSAFDGTHGVDSQDIMNIPEMGFSTFQLFPDQENYGPVDPNLDALNNTIQTGINWIQQQAQVAMSLGKPSMMTGYGIVTQNNLPFFVPFNSSQAIISFDNATANQLPLPTAVGVEQGQLPVSDQDQLTIYSQWIQAAIQAGVSGITQYQWGQTNLTEPPQQNQIPLATTDTNTFIPALGQQNMSPNDGYQGITGALQQVLQVGALEQNSMSMGGL